MVWGQIGVSEAVSGSPSSSAISDALVQEFQSKTESDPAKSPCFPVGLKNTSHCLLTAGMVPTSSGLSMEVGVLLMERLSNLETWQTFLRKMQLPGAELLALESQDGGRQRGSSAAGNLLWLFQSLYRTYSRTRELLEVFLSLGLAG